MFRPKAYIPRLDEWAEVYHIEYDKLGKIIGVVLNIDQEYPVDIIDDTPRFETSPYWEINKVILIWNSGLFDRDQVEIHTDDIIIDIRNNWRYAITFDQGTFWAVKTGPDNYRQRLDELAAFSNVVNNVNNIHDEA